jgi:NADPH2 dehydrogenase
VDCSSGFVVPETFKNIKFGPGFQVQFSESIKKGVSGILTAAVGGITNGTQMEEILNSRGADLILVGTQFLRNPFLVYSSALELGVAPKEAASVLPPQVGFWLQKTRLEQLNAKTAAAPAAKI